MAVSSDVLVERARQRVGLDDLGPGPWSVGLERLLDVVADDVHDLAVVDRIHELLIDRLCCRLRIEGWYREHGADASDPVVGPLVVFGLPRTATTAVHHLLAIDDRLRYLRSWELKDPVPPPVLATELDDPRRPREVESSVRHIATVDGPAEDWPIHGLAFDHAELTLPVPSYTSWWRTRDHDGLFSYHERVLRMLHSHRPPTRWLLKMPTYLFLLPEMAAHYPDASFVMTHRDPVAVIASACSTIAHSRQQRIPSWQPDAEFGRQMLDHWADGMMRAMAARDAVGEDRFVDVAQRELEADPVDTAERIFALAGLSLDGTVADSMRSWAVDNRRGVRGAHVYSLEQFGLSAGDVTRAFCDYLSRFGSFCA